MPTNTTNLNLFKYDTVADKNSTFNITQALNDNWDKLDNFLGSIDSNWGNIQGNINNQSDLIKALSYNVFCVNYGAIDSSGNPALLTLTGNSLSTNGNFICTTASGLIFGINEILTVDISDLSEGEYNIFIDPVAKTLECLQNKIYKGAILPDNAQVNDLLLNNSRAPYALTKKTTMGEEVSNFVFAGKLTISSDNSGGGGKLSINPYNINFLTSFFEIGLPIRTLSNFLADNEIWLEGAEVSKETYAELYAVYGDTYGTPENENNFILPDYRGRTGFGIGQNDNFGYIKAGLPNIKGTWRSRSHSNSKAGAVFENPSGCFYQNNYIEGGYSYGMSNQNIAYRTQGMNASRSSSIYGASTTVQPPAIKERVKTRYK